MAYLLPRAVIVLLAWGATCLAVHLCTAVDPRLFYIGGGVWSLVGLAAFGHLLRCDGDQKTPVRRAAARSPQLAE